MIELKKDICIITVTKNGLELGNKIKKNFINNEIDVFTILKFSNSEVNLIDKSIVDFVGDIFFKYKTLVFVTATGIAVRSISKYIKSKETDPAVIVIDEQGQFVIPILSGHLGGANETSIAISKIINGSPILTTASDVSGKIAVDTFAMKINGKIQSLEDAKKVTSLIVAGENVQIKVPDNISSDNPSGVIIVSNKENIEISKIIPKNISIGIGCKFGTTKEAILSTLELALKKSNISKDAIKIISTIDIKKNEKGLIEAVSELKTSLNIISIDDIKEIHLNYKQSDFVYKTIGVGAVSAPAAFLASSKKGRMLEEKFIHNGVTISIYEEETKINE